MLSIAMMLSLSQCVTVDDGGYYPGSYNSGDYRHRQGGYRHGHGQGGYGRQGGYRHSRQGGRYENHYDNDDHDAENYYPQGSRQGGYPPYRSGNYTPRY